jgi:uncharacterized protein
LKGKILIFLLTFLFSSVSGFEIPDFPVARVNDFASILSEEAKRKLENILYDYEMKTQNQLVVVTIPSLDGEDLETFSIKLAEKWKIGKKGKNNGVLLLVVMKERKIRIEVGYGLEDRLTDAVASGIIRNYIAPYFRTGDYEGGIFTGVKKIIQVTAGEGGEEFSNENGKKELRKLLIIFYFFLLFLLLLVLIDIVRYIAFLMRGSNLNLFEWILLFSITYLFFKLIFYGFIYSGRGGYTIGKRGGFGGGSFGGGFGGFSGGGGSFGGGGASGSW